MTQFLAQRRSVANRGDTVGIHCGSTQRPIHKGDTQLPGVGADFLAIRTFGRGRPVHVANVGTTGRIQQSSTVAHRQGQGVFSRQLAGRVSVLGPERIAGARRLEPEELRSRRRECESSRRRRCRGRPAPYERPRRRPSRRWNRQSYAMYSTDCASLRTAWGSVVA